MARKLVGRGRHVRDPPREGPDARARRRPGRRRRHLRRRTAWSARWSTSARPPTPSSTLDAGATLTVSHQNSDRSIDAALERRDRPVVLDLAARPPGVPGRAVPARTPRLGVPRGGDSMKNNHHAAADRRSPARCLLAAGRRMRHQLGRRDDGGQGTAPRAFTPPDVPMQKSLGDMEGQVNILAWPGYAEDGTTDKTVDWVTPFEKQTGCQAEREVLRHLRRGGQADGDRGVRRGLGLRRRLAAADRVRRRGAGQHRPARELRRHRAVPQGPRVELRRRPDVRRPARLGRQPADVQHRRRQAGADQLGRGLRRRVRCTPARSRRTTRRSTSPTPRST